MLCVDLCVRKLNGTIFYCASIFGMARHAAVVAALSVCSWSYRWSEAMRWWCVSTELTVIVIEWRLTKDVLVADAQRWLASITQYSAWLNFPSTVTTSVLTHRSISVTKKQSCELARNPGQKGNSPIGSGHTGPRDVIWSFIKDAALYHLCFITHSRHTTSRKTIAYAIYVQ